MCGIAGFQGDFDPSLLRRMADTIAHRGPDDSGVWHSRPAKVGLAHRRLSIIDLSPAGHQPMIDKAGGAVIVFNGEIYNFRELRADLEATGEEFRGHSDTEVLLVLYRRYGEAMLTMLNGIFAFAMWDPATDALLLACDAMGVKPAYFAEGRQGFVFASELKALMRTGAVNGHLDMAALSRYLGFLWSPGGATPFKGVHRLQPGEALSVKGGRIIRRWQWVRSTWAEAPLDIDVGEAIQRVHDGVRTAVRRQMVADVPVGAFLSGGLDSSAVVQFAREQAPDIQCFTINLGTLQDPGVTDDLPYAQQVARHLGVAMHEIHVSPSEMARDLVRMFAQLDEPLADPAPLNVWYICSLARRYGIKVLLSGAGGDDLFSGYRRHVALRMERYWAWMPTPSRRLLRQLAAYLESQYRGLGWRLNKAFGHADWSAERRLTGYFHWTDGAHVRQLLAPDHGGALAGEDLSAPLEAYLATLPRGLSPLQRILALEQRFFLADHNLVYTDKMSMAAGIEVRVPFLDNDLVRFANRLPSKFKLRGATTKWVFKKAMEPYLPSTVIHRSKTGFGSPLRMWLRGELKQIVDDTLSPSCVRRRGLFDPQAVARLIADDRAGRIDASYTILAVLCIEWWCQAFVDNAWGNSRRDGMIAQKVA